MRINLYLNEDDPKDKIITEFLKKRYSAPGFIKETLFGMATGSALSVSDQKDIGAKEEVEPPLNEEYEDIENADTIEL